MIAVGALAAGCGRLRFTDESGDAGADTSAGDSAVARANRVFATSGTLTGDLGGLAGADAICAARAGAGGLPGTFVAFLSTSSVDAIGRLAGSRGWVRMDGKPVVDTVADLMAEQQYYPIALDEHGQTVTNGIATGSHSTGLADPPSNCAEWASAGGSACFGSPTASSGASVRIGYAACNSPLSIYCFELGNDYQVEPPAVVTGGRVVFVTTSDWTFGALSTADALCNSEASTAGLPGTYTALLGSVGASPASRLSSLAGPWKRTDGRLITAGALDSMPLELPPVLSASGAQPVGDAYRYVWMGAGGLTVAGDTVSTCADWTMPTSTGYGTTGYSDETSPASFGWVQALTRCDGTLPIYCAQQ